MQRLHCQRMVRPPFQQLAVTDKDGSSSARAHPCGPFLGTLRDSGIIRTAKGVTKMKCLNPYSDDQQADQDRIGTAFAVVATVLFAVCALVAGLCFYWAKRAFDTMEVSARPRVLGRSVVSAS